MGLDSNVQRWEPGTVHDPHPPLAIFLAQWPMYVVSRRLQMSPSNAESGGSSRCRIITDDFGDLKPNGRNLSRRRFAIDPFLPVANFQSNDGSTPLTGRLLPSG